jgi:hypothetical protein
MNYWLALIAVALIVSALREVYRDLFHPTSSGSLSDFVAKTLFSTFRHAPRLLSDAGPLSIVLVIFIWAVAIAVGFALFYSAMPVTYFQTQTGPQAGILRMLYFSLEVLTTSGLGEYPALPVWLRLVVTFEAIVGFAVLTASVSSIILLDQALGRMRTLARKLSVVQRTRRAFDVQFSETSDHMLVEFSAEIVRTRVDLVHFPVVYYFYADNERSSLPQVLPVAVSLAREALPSSEPSVHRGGAILLVALRDLADLLRSRYVSIESDDCGRVFEAYARHHSPASGRQ